MILLQFSFTARVIKENDFILCMSGVSGIRDRAGTGAKAWIGHGNILRKEFEVTRISFCFLACCVEISPVPLPHL